MVDVIKRHNCPSSRFELLFVKFIYVVLHVAIYRTLVPIRVLREIIQQLLILPLIVLLVLLVFGGCVEVLEVLADDAVHLEWIEVLLVIKHVTNGLSLLFYLSKLKEEHVIELREVLLHVVHGDALAQLVEDGLNAAIELTLKLSNLSIVVLVGLSVLLKPVLAVCEHLFHSVLQVVISGFVLKEFIPHIDERLSHVRFSS